MKRRDFIKIAGAGCLLNFMPLRAEGVKSAKLRGYLRTNWSRDPFSFGSYSYFAKGSKRSDARALGKPVAGRVFFAGEACHPKYNSTVHAAYESGILAAEAISEFDYQRIAIIGAGISGLAAADALSKSGSEVVIFEGRDRIGGRIWTRRTQGLPLDLGASWIHGIEGNPLAELSDEMGLRTIATDDSSVVRGRDGRLIEDHEMPDWLEEVTEVQHQLGAGSESINGRAYWSDADYGGPDVVFPDGYSGVFDVFRGDYSVELNAEVIGVDYSEKGVELRLNGSANRAFDAVLATVPLGVLKAGKLEFRPPLPARKLKAIDRLGMGTLDKVYLLFDEVFWDRDATWIITPENGLPRGEFNQWLNFYPMLGEPVILAFNGGAPARALAACSEDEIIAKALQALRSAY